MRAIYSFLFSIIFLFSGFLLKAQALEDILSNQCSQRLVGMFGEEPPKVFRSCLNQYSYTSGKFLLYNMPDRLINWASGGQGGVPWRFADQNFNNFFIAIHEYIASNIPGIILSPHDLFHGHLILYGQDRNELNELAILFHAKEYPSDLEFIKNNYQSELESFASYSPSFENRNFLFFNNNIYLLTDSGPCTELFAADQINTVSETKIKNKLPNAKNWGDVNIFKKSNINRIKYNLNQQEFFNTNKGIGERIELNFKMNSWISKQPGEYILFFMTGLG